MKVSEFRKHAHEMIDWMADYLDEIEEYPVKSQVEPGDITNQIPEHLPEQGESIEKIFSDFQEIIIPGITHWQSPNYFAYFQANSSPPSVLAEMLTATLGVQGMKWETSPASTELENKMMDWLMDAMRFPKSWSGVIQDSGSSATLTAILSAREKHSNFKINKNGFLQQPIYRVYCSDQTHSSIEKGAKIAGIGKENVIKIETNQKLELSSNSLKEQIRKDISMGYQPLCIVCALGTTGTLAFDPLSQIAEIANEYKIWLHIDAAYAGSAMILQEYEHLFDGIEKADSFMFNPHKWMFTNFDCSAYFVKDKSVLINTFVILPEYLKTKTDGQVDNHCDWGIPLGRRFRSLKLWFVLRYYGLEGLQEKIRYHIDLAKWLEKQIDLNDDFEMMAPRHMNLVCFRYHPNEVSDLIELNRVNELILNQINATGKMYITHTKVFGKYTLRMSIGQTTVEDRHVEEAWQIIQDKARNMTITSNQ